MKGGQHSPRGFFKRRERWARCALPTLRGRARFSRMTKTQVQIIGLFRTLDPAQQREIAAQLYETTVAGSFYDRMTPAQRAALDEGIAQAERGQVLPAEEVFNRLAKRFGFSAE
jgi:predicted transcriptional regulator